MEVGLFTRNGKHLVGRIGALDLAWDRTAGGKLQVAYNAPAGAVPVGAFAMQAILEETPVTTASDADPRLIPVETGPHRLVLRAVQQLGDASGRHLGDAMQETWAWADGDLYLNGMLRLIDPARGGRLIEAFAEIRFSAGWRSVPENADGVTCLVHETGLHLAVARDGNGSAWAVPIEGGDPWERLNGQPPYYRRWGPYYDQWGGDAGWAACVLETRPEEPVIRAFWAHGDAGERRVIDAFRGTLALLFAQDAGTLAQKLTAFKSPLAPAVKGGRALYHASMDGTTVVRKTGASLKLTFPPDPAERTARLCVCGTKDLRVLRSAGGSAVFPLTDGGVTDDPNGPDLLRPDDRHGPILTDGRVRPDDALVILRLAKDRETHVELTPAPGLQLACQKWDDRQNLLLFSSAHPQGCLFALSLRDLKIRGMRIPGFQNPVMAQLPLYWFQANAFSAHHCLNVAERFDLIENGPDAVRFRVRSHNPARTAQSEIEVAIPFLQDRLNLDLTCKFTALARWDLPEVQYCNFFPEETREPHGWNADRVLAMAGDGQQTRIDPRARGEAQVQAGGPFRFYEGPLFVALYGGPDGNIFALSHPRETAGARPGYQLCGCWLDNHLFLSSPGDTIPAGTRYEVKMSLTMARTTNIDTDIEAMGRRALEAGELAI